MLGPHPHEGSRPQRPESTCARVHLGRVLVALQEFNHDALDAVATRLVDAWREHRRVFCLGNGGSAATASHLANDLQRVTAVAGASPLRALSLADHVPALTSVANDLSYDSVFVEQLKVWLEPHDVVLGLSTSGQSPNVLRAFDFANERGACTVAFTGSDGDLLRARASLVVGIESNDVQVIEDVCLVAAHMLVKTTHAFCHAMAESHQTTSAIRP